MTSCSSWTTTPPLHPIGSSGCSRRTATTTWSPSGGAPRPDYGRPRPSWFPHEFNWVFGCAYRGLPEERAATPRLIGASMSVRREALLEIGGFHSDNHDDMDMCHRLQIRWPNRVLVYEPAAVVHHFVHPDRLTWRYFWRRCFFVNRGKVAAHHNIGTSGNLDADAAFVRRTLTRGAMIELRAALGGDGGAVLRMLATAAGVALAAAGYAVGTVELARNRST